MNIEWVIPCRYLEVHDNLGTMVGAGLDTWWIPELPQPIQVVMAIRLTGLPDELGADVEHTGRSVVRGPDGQALSEVQGTFRLGGGQIVERPDWLQGVLMPALIGFEAAVEGTYTCEHVVDGSSFSVPLHIVNDLPPGFEPPA